MHVVNQGLGIPNLTLGDAPDSAIKALRSLLERIPLNVTANLSFATGVAVDSGQINGSPRSVWSRVRSGQIWVDYGRYPFFQSGSGFLQSQVLVPIGIQGFGTFMRQAGLEQRIPPPPQNTFTQGHALFAVYGSTPANDPYDFDLADWTWGHLVPGYPYGYGFPTLADLGRTGLAAVPPPNLAPSGQVSLPGGTVHVYSMFALRIGKGWYFEAQPEIPPDAYAQFIANTLGLRTPVATSPRVGGNTPMVAVRPQSTVLATAQVQVPSPSSLPVLRYGDRGPAVMLLQERLIDHGFNVGPTGADGIFGSNTLAAVRAFRARERITVDGVVGPQTWARLLSIQGAFAPAAQSLAGELAGYEREVRQVAATATQTGGGGTATQVKRLTAVSSRPSPTGIWVGGHGYAVVGGKRVPIPNAPIGGGVVVVNGYKVHFPPRPSSQSQVRSTTSRITSEVQKLLGEEAKALGITPQTAEWLDIAAGVGLALLLVTQAQSKK